MLPLWIIDLNRNMDLCADFQRRLGSLPGTRENWCYSNFSDIDFDNEDWFKLFLQELVEKGQTAIRGLKTIKPINECCMNICVIGDATEEFSLKFFSSVAALVKREKGRLIPGHIHQGINILGMLYVPSDIHNADFPKRQAVLRCLKELDLQHRVNLAAGYDRIMLYQDTQRRTAKFYPLLNVEQRMDYLMQCLIHLYYICDGTHPLLDANAADDFFFSLGLGSLYYDTNEQDENDLRLVGNNIFTSLKEKGTVDSFDLEISIFDLPLVSVGTLFDTLKVDLPEVIDLTSLDIEEPNPHPISKFMDKHLLQLFYRGYLVRYPGELLNKIVEKIANCTHDFLIRLNDRAKGYYEKMEDTLRKKIKEILHVNVSPEVGCMELLRNKIREFKKALGKMREEVKDETDNTLWNSIIVERIPKRYHDAFNDYHTCFKQDEADTSATNCDDLKAEATGLLTKLLSHEPTLLSTMVRCFLAGIILVLAIMPVIEFVSPTFVNLGNVKKWSYIWAAALFMIPILIAYFKKLRYYHKIRIYADRLIAYHLHDAYARVVNRAQNQIYWFYDRMVDLCSEYEKRLDKIDEETEVMDDTHIYSLVLPKTMFNQPVIGGKCCDIPLFPDSEMNRNKLSIRGNIARVDKISKKQQYTIVHDYSDLFLELFDGVKVYDKIARDPSSKELSTFTDEDIEEFREQEWAKAKGVFHRDFVEKVKMLIVPRTDKTIAQRLNLLASMPENQDGFRIFAEFCEPSGEFVANDDKEFADIKTNSTAMRNAFAQYIPLFSTQVQVSTDDMYRSFLFLTKWRTFSHISPNRILPETDLFDKDIFERWAKPPKSSLLLFALIGNMSAEWYELFSSRALTDIPDYCKVYKDEIERRK